MSPGRVDREVVRRHLLALDRVVQNLAGHRGHPAEKLATDMDELWAVERGLQLAAQNVLDVATHIAAAHGRDVTDYASAIDELAELEILPRDFAHRLRPLAGFRNVLVHAYLEVDPQRVHSLLNDHLGEFATFAAHVETHLAKEPESTE